MKKKYITALLLTALLTASLTACGNANQQDSSSSAAETKDTSAATTSAATTSGATGASVTAENTGVIAGEQNQTLSDNQNLTITKAGTYTVSGSAKNATVIVDAGDDDKVEIILNGVSVTNDSSPAIYVKNAGDTTVTTQKGSANTLSVTGSFSTDGDTKTDAVLFAKDDLTLSGEGTLAITSTDNGISGKDDVTITSGSLNINCASDAIEANDEITVKDGNISINTQKDGLHAENDQDNTQGSVTVSGGTLDIKAGSDGIQGTTTAIIDGGTLNITAAEGIEATNVTINNGDITIAASDDGINATQKSTSQSVAVTINGGNIKITMGQGDTDGIDSNGDLLINGGTIDITGQSACDYDGTAKKTGGTLIINGTQTDTIPNQMMGGPGGNMRGNGMGTPGGGMPNGNQMPGGFAG